MQRIATGLAGLALAALGVVGVIHGARAQLANALYFACKYGRWVEQTDPILAAAERAQRLYPHNYLMSVVAGEAAYYNRFDAAGKERPDRLAAAAAWCAIGLAQNPHASQLRMLDMRLTERRSLPEAVRKWETYVDWECWEPYNHVVLVDLYGKAGRYREALEALEILEPWPESRALAQRKLDDAWRGEINAMRSLQDAAR